MAEHAKETEETRVQDAPRSRRDVQVDWRRAKDRSVGLLAGIVRWAGLIFAAILVLHVIFVVGSANPGNGIVSWVRGWAGTFSIGFADIFEPADPKLRVLVNFGLAALFWLVVSGVLARIIRRIGGLGS
ncbi:MAG TPA: hypothetical protein VFG87_29170 [Amycolatopsis sp.]|jgi:hypothetical protein|nr:hypothetical protein [Amycolatopsis sp.]